MSRSSSGHQSRSGTVASKHRSMDLRARETPSPLSSSRSHSGSSRDELPEIPQHERFSALPRTPSSLSMTSGIDHISTYDSTKTPTGKRRRTPGLFPPTMLFQDILKRKSALERGAAYTRRLAELMEDSSGLEDWVQHMKQRHKPPPNRNSVRISIRPVRPPGVHPMQPRHVSNGSIASEATFPIRADAYLAQDLTPHDDTDLSPPTGPPALPYPGLASAVSARSALAAKPGFSPSSSLRSIATSSSTGGKSSGGFFATISRKASMNKKPGPPLPLAPQPSLTNRLISRRTTQALPQPRPVKVGPATIVGGPRDPPGPRMMRSRTVGADAFAAVRQAAGNTTSSPVEPKAINDAFTRGLKGMADVLPNVDRDILAVYLQRANGKEIEAIHTYLNENPPQSA
ncbi:hypothetical protein EXIGLDRAFT_13026 [Exidia glandulosa HHB12029]|uniref:Uncharacterized protein n=1 Tax=Exidia glandulosa HHB12029 TaxID=1314781 RepID=A0A165QTF6_EXIGL|nr:hypothetical protein EXIGLDRAFT_13026 [Exidia glandulosa HHB12029]